MKLENLTDLELDALREISSIGAGHASTALSALVNVPIEISFPWMRICPLEGVSDCIDSPEKEVASIYLHIDGKSLDHEFEVCSLFLTFPIESAIHLSKSMQGEEPSGTELTEMDRCALMELGNIIVGSYLTAIGEFLDFKLVESLPYIASDMLDSVVDPVISQHAYDSADALVFNTLFSTKGKEVGGYLVVLFYSPAQALIKDMKYIKEMEK
jgi:chemotaxis protein CheC